MQKIDQTGAAEALLSELQMIDEEINDFTVLDVLDALAMCGLRLTLDDGAKGTSVSRVYLDHVATRLMEEG